MLWRVFQNPSALGWAMVMNFKTFGDVATCNLVSTSPPAMASVAACSQRTAAMTACGFPSPLRPLNFDIHCHRAYLLRFNFTAHFPQPPLSTAFFKVDRLPVPTVTQPTSDLSTFLFNSFRFACCSFRRRLQAGCDVVTEIKWNVSLWNLVLWLRRYLRTRHLRGVLCWKSILCASCNVRNSQSMVWSMVWLNCELL